MATVTKGRTFVSGETVTPTKLNELIDNATVTSIVDADVSASAAIALSKLATGALPTAITTTTGNIVDASVTQAKLAAGVVGNGPAFRAAASAGTTLTSGGFTKVTLGTEQFDTNNNFASSTFTPTVAGYYQVNGRVYVLANPEQLQAMIYKNGSIHSYGSVTTAKTFGSVVSDIIYMNGTTDYIELYAYQLSGTSQTTTTGSEFTYMSACLVRAA